MMKQVALVPVFESVDTPILPTLSKLQLQGIDSISAYSFLSVRERLIEDKVIPTEKVDEAIDEFRKFLVLALLYPDCRIAMISKYVDEVWHTFILFTREYVNFTQKVFGYYLHHSPATATMPIDVSYSVDFIRMYEYTFGKLPSIWRSKADCSTDDGSSGDTNDDSGTEISSICQGGRCDNDPPTCSIEQG